jgi:hypothetical protein
MAARRATRIKAMELVGDAPRKAMLRRVPDQQLATRRPAIIMQD